MAQTNDIECPHCQEHSLRVAFNQAVQEHNMLKQDLDALIRCGHYNLMTIKHCKNEIANAYFDMLSIRHHYEKLYCDHFISLKINKDCSKHVYSFLCSWIEL